MELVGVTFRVVIRSGSGSTVEYARQFDVDDSGILRYDRLRDGLQRVCGPAVPWQIKEVDALPIDHPQNQSQSQNQNQNRNQSEAQSP